MATYSGSIAQLYCGEGGTLQTNTAGLYGKCLQWMAHMGLLQPRSKLLRLLVLCEDTVPHELCILCNYHVQVTQFPRCSMNAQSQVAHVSPQGSWSQAVILLTHMNHQGSQEEDVVSNWQPAHSLVGNMVFGAKIVAAPCLHLWLSCTCLSASREGHKWQLTCSSLLFVRVWSFVLWACQGSLCSVRAFQRERSFVFLCFSKVSMSH